MIRSCALVVAAATLLPVTAAAQEVNIRTKKDGKQSITTMMPVEPPKGPAPIRPRVYLPWGLNDPEVTPVVMHAHDWVCGRRFIDDSGRIWRLVYGPPEAPKPEWVSGWMIRSAEGHLYFLSVLGGLFAPCVPGPVLAGPPNPLLLLSLGESLPLMLNPALAAGQGPTAMREATLSARDWVGGKQFVDGDGVTWRLIAGPAAAAAPEKVRGWLATNKDTQIYFIGASGGVFFPYQGAPARK